MGAGAGVRGPAETVRLRRRGDLPAPPRSRLRLPRRRRRAGRRRAGAGADSRPGDPAGLGRRLDLRPAQRAHPGDRDRRRRAQAVPLPRRAGSGGPRQRKFERCGASPPPCRGCVARSAATSSATGMPPRAGAGLRRPPARPRLLPHRRRGVRRGERAATGWRRCAASTSPSRRRGDRLRLPGQERAAAACSRSATRPRCGRSSGCAAAAAAPRTCSPSRTAALARRPLGRHQRLHPGARRRGVLRQGLPHLERHRAGGDRPRRQPAEIEARRANARSARPSRRSPSCSATPPPSAAPPTSTPASSTATATATRSRPFAAVR